ncbi:Gfo/Idh/MocA family oxidoreductase [Lentzea sp.]|uniref:Gfo/Idh/MocA family oxidoreductase n=1 Tax=Lentzea sp. TaxID=56099 RepID=UPI002CC69235|nr:Gfo/Idh/MocA family oxidoreductase [Lentzea sp.]HUQ56460.1 Gfo/Idh/MocA family oxidoreductase [Lentzea sp.]
MTPVPQHTALVGFGHSARMFHLPALADLVARGHATGQLTIVDPAYAGSPAPVRGTVLRQLPPPDPHADTVVHVCTPPDTHARIVAEASELGYRRFVVEKPMATRPSEAAAMIELCERGLADVVVVANWSASALTDEIRRVLDARAQVPVRTMSLSQCKPRFERTMTNAAHRSAFDVEIPHLVTLLLALLGDEKCELVSSASSDLRVGDVSYPGMGAAELVLRTGGGADVTLRSDLAAPRRERSTRIVWEDGFELTGFHPCDSADRYAQLFTRAAPDAPVLHQLLFDDTVRRFLFSAYAHFAGVGPKPTSDVRFGARVTQIISAAKDVSVTTPHRPERLLEASDGAGTSS